MSANPALDPVTSLPTGLEPIGSVQSLSRSYYNAAGQVSHSDDYFAFPPAPNDYNTSATFGTPNTHFYRTEFAYDDRGRVNRTKQPDGTIYRTVFDGRGRVTSEWMGDNDTVTEEWSEDNSGAMVKVKAYEYDNDGIGDGHLTRTTITGLADTGLDPTPDRATTQTVDFRGRVTRVDLPDPDGGGFLEAPFYETVYDNLGRVKVSTDLLGQITTYEYDTLARKVTTTYPDPDGEYEPLSSPMTYVVTNSRGMVESETDPRLGITTYEYDGAGRINKVTQPDPDTEYGPLAAPETVYQYDAVGNLRFLTDPRGNITEYEYDMANRQAKVKQPDADGVAPFSYPETVYAYDDAGLLETITDPLTA